MKKNKKTLPIILIILAIILFLNRADDWSFIFFNIMLAAFSFASLRVCENNMLKEKIKLPLSIGFGVLLIISIYHDSQYIKEILEAANPIMEKMMNATNGVNHSSNYYDWEGQANSIANEVLADYSYMRDPFYIPGRLFWSDFPSSIYYIQIILLLGVFALLGYIAYMIKENKRYIYIVGAVSPIVMSASVYMKLLRLQDIEKNWGFIIDTENLGVVYEGFTTFSIIMLSIALLSIGIYMLSSYKLQNKNNK